LNHVTSHAIDLIEAAYDLDKLDGDWLPNLIQAGAPILDQGLGVVGFEFVRAPGGGAGEARLENMRLERLPEDFLQRFEAARQFVSAACFREITKVGFAGTWSEVTRDYPDDRHLFLDALGYPDLLGITAVDPNGVGVQFVAPMPKNTKLTPKARERWKMLGAHIASAFRLRQALIGAHGPPEDNPTGLPRDAEAIFDASGFRIVDSVGQAKNKSAADILREAARNVDRARGDLRREDPQQALKVWTALVRGRWSMLDWFDTDGRRFVLALPNAPKLTDPRGLTDQESQVVSFVLHGETSKMIAYRVGLSAPRVSGLLKSAMRKLGVTSRTQLVEKLGPVVAPQAAEDGDSEP
jgi:DNA-binding CsgD family transcriptional regulator